MNSLISFNSSSNSSSNSSTCVKDITKEWETNCMASCVLGISKIGMASNLSYDYAHAALLLLDKQIDYNGDCKYEKDMGILIEYGDYSPDMNKKEKNFVDKGYVVYHYGNKGGLRYYGKKYKEFIKDFGDIGYIDFNIAADNQNTFEYFLSHITNLEEKKWIKERYVAFGFINSFNCQTFAKESIKLLKPYYTFANISPRAMNLLAAKKYKDKYDFVPKDIKNILDDYYKRS